MLRKLHHHAGDFVELVVNVGKVLTIDVAKVKCRI